MKNNISIKVENIGKKYNIKHRYQKVNLLHYTIHRNIASAFDFLNPFGSKFGFYKSNINEELWALRNINFEVNRGDWIGVMGNNGAGKTTLLRLLSRITEPTTGKISINGNVASLLGVGTGFHSELTGRENIFLNGIILGMSRNEIKAKFDEIVDFSECEQFLDIPTKYYSSGINLRIAFSVATHLKPNILIIDETLAVGDASFQKKCFKKIEEIRQDGITVFLATHSLGAIKKYCNQALLIDKGELIKNSRNVDAVIDKYDLYK